MEFVEVSWNFWNLSSSKVEFSEIKRNFWNENRFFFELKWNQNGICRSQMKFL